METTPPYESRPENDSLDLERDNERALLERLTMKVHEALILLENLGIEPDETVHSGRKIPFGRFNFGRLDDGVLHIQVTANYGDYYGNIEYIPSSEDDNSASAFHFRREIKDTSWKLRDTAVSNDYLITRLHGDWPIDGQPDSTNVGRLFQSGHTSGQDVYKLLVDDLLPHAQEKASEISYRFHYPIAGVIRESYVEDISLTISKLRDSKGGWMVRVTLRHPGDLNGKPTKFDDEFTFYDDSDPDICRCYIDKKTGEIKTIDIEDLESLVTRGFEPYIEALTSEKLGELGD